jgi:hypothetical protein
MLCKDCFAGECSHFGKDEYVPECHFNDGVDPKDVPSFMIYDLKNKKWINTHVKGHDSLKGFK